MLFAHKLRFFISLPLASSSERHTIYVSYSFPLFFVGVNKTSASLYEVYSVVLVLQPTHLAETTKKREYFYKKLMNFI